MISLSVSKVSRGGVYDTKWYSEVGHKCWIQLLKIDCEMATLENFVVWCLRKWWVWGSVTICLFSFALYFEGFFHQHIRKKMLWVQMATSCKASQSAIHTISPHLSNPQCLIDVKGQDCPFIFNLRRDWSYTEESTEE